MAEAREGEAPWLYAGIDEAGYGPVLGPLCVAASVFEVCEPVGSDAAAPDLWRLLRRGVSRTPGKSGRGRRLPIADSKVVKLPNPKPGDPGARDPLMHLERGVLAMLHAKGVQVKTLEDLLGGLGAEASPLPWYRAGESEGEAIPGATTAEHVRMHGAHLAGVMQAACVRVRAMRCISIDEQHFNTQLREHGVKSGVSFDAVGALLREVWEVAGSSPASCPRVVVDRQGGRTSYGEALEQALPNAEIEVLCETPARSAYAVHGRAAEQRRSMRVYFEVEAEQRHLPLALASMTAKLVRELMMRRFNRHFCARMAELKPTAGYHSDGMRWLRDAEVMLSADERATLRRKA